MLPESRTDVDNGKKHRVKLRSRLKLPVVKRKRKLLIADEANVLSVSLGMQVAEKLPAHWVSK